MLPAGMQQHTLQSCTEIFDRIRNDPCLLILKHVGSRRLRLSLEPGVWPGSSASTTALFKSALSGPNFIAKAQGLEGIAVKS